MAFLATEIASRLINRKIMLWPGEVGRFYEPERNTPFPFKGNLAGSIKKGIHEPNPFSSIANHAAS